MKMILLLGINDVVEEYAEKFLKINLKKDIMRCPDITTHYTEFGKYVNTAREYKPAIITTQCLEIIDVLLESDLDFDVVTVRKYDDGEIRARFLPKEEVIKDRESFCFDPRL